MRIPKEKRKLPIPYLEISFAFFAIYAAILFFMSDFKVLENVQSDAAALMLQIMPPVGWGVAFLSGALLLSIGMVSNFLYCKICGPFRDDRYIWSAGRMSLAGLSKFNIWPFCGFDSHGPGRLDDSKADGTIKEVHL